MSETVDQLKIVKENGVKFIPLIKMSKRIFDEKATRLRFITNDGDRAFIPTLKSKTLDPFETNLTKIRIAKSDDIFYISGIYYKYLETSEDQDLSEWKTIHDTNGTSDFSATDNMESGEPIRGNYSLELETGNQSTIA